MTVLAPPEPPREDELEALIHEARARQRRRRLLLAIGVVAAAGLGVALWIGLSGGGPTRHGGTGRLPTPGSIRRIETGGRRVPVVATGSSGGVTWAANGGGLWLSANGGRSWRRSVPPHVAATGDPVARVDEVEFVDRLHGWISASDVYGGFAVPTAAASVRHMEIDRTKDGGRTWQASLPPGCFEVCSGATVSFTDARHGHALVDLETGGGRLYSTRDGGATWTLVRRVRRSGSIALLGHRWLPRRALPRRTFSSVRAFGPQLVVFGLRAHGKRRFQLVGYTSSDGGRHWLAKVAPAWVRLGPPDNADAISTPSASDWVQPSGRQLFVTHDAGRSWHVIRLADLPRDWFVSQVLFTSPQVGWAIFAAGGQHLFRSVLVRTTDGGVHWTPAGPRLPRRHRHR